jgi:hypothetical protein
MDILMTSLPENRTVSLRPSGSELLLLQSWQGLAAAVGPRNAERVLRRFLAEQGMPKGSIHEVMNSLKDGSIPSVPEPLKVTRSPDTSTQSDSPHSLEATVEGVRRYFLANGVSDGTAEDLIKTFLDGPPPAEGKKHATSD